LLLESSRVEFLGLESEPLWLARIKPPRGVFTALRVVLDEDSVAAMDRAGATMPISTLGDEWIAPLDEPLRLGFNNYERLVLDLDLSASLSGDLPPLIFAPIGFAVTDRAPLMEIDEVYGRVSSKDPDRSSLRLSAFAPGEVDQVFGEVDVELLAGTVLVAEDGSTLPSQADFFAAVEPGTLLYVYGNVDEAGRLEAGRIEIEGDAMGANPVKIEGLVLTAGAASFELLIRELESGAEIAEGVLANLGNPASIEVSFDAMTRFLFDDNSDATSADLREGVKVKAKFASFMNEPFAATLVEIDVEEPEIEGVVVDVSGMPDTLTMRALSNEPAVRTGLIASAETNVLVEIGNLRVRLDTRGNPSIARDLIQVGMQLEVQGTLAGPATAPVLTASRVTVHAGRFGGFVTASSRGTNSFDAQVTQVFAPLGELVSSPPFAVVFSDGAAVQGSALDVDGFFDLAESLQVDDVLAVQVLGIGSGVPNEVLAFEVEALFFDL
jgi:hypothetical protein